MRAAIVGCGSIAHVHAESISRLSDITLTAFADIIGERAQDFRNRYGGNAYSSLEEMLAKEKPDVLHICTPHYLHVPMMLYALKHGIHVFSEKPPVISKDQLDELLSLHTEKYMGFCFQNRYNPSIRLVKKLLESKAAGNVIGARGIVTWERDASYYNESGWRGKQDTEGGGALINQAIHTMDLLVYLLGTPLSVDAGMNNHHLKGVIEVEDTLEAYIRFPDASAVFYATTAYCENVPPLIELSCEDRTIRIEDHAVTYYYRDGRIETPKLSSAEALGKSYWGSGHVSCIADFYKSLCENSRFSLDLPGTLDTIRLMLASYESARTQKEIFLLDN